MKNTRLQTVALFLGNILEHYDTALYGLLSPFLAPLFFPEMDPVTGLILTYAIIPAGILARPVGSLFFGHFGDNYGRGKALSLSLIGMAGTCALFALIPTFNQVGYFAPLLLLLGRVVQSFFASGWCGAIPLLENREEKKKNLMSALYGSSTVLGILCASAGVGLFAHLGWIEKGWRWLYLIGSSTLFLGFFLRNLDVETAVQKSLPFTKRLQSLWTHRGPLLTLIFANGFSYATYSVALVLLNGFVPLITDISKTEMMDMNTTLLLLDFLTLPLFALLSQRYSRGRVMIGAAITSGLLGIPLFSLLEGATLLTVLFVRVCLVIIGVWFCTAFQAWALDIAPKGHSYTLISFSKAVGGQVLGAPTAAISIGAYHMTGSVSSVAWYWVALGFATAVLMVRAEMRRPVTLPIHS